MNANHKDLLSMGLTIGIVCFTLFIVHKFIPSMVWAGIIVIATYPLYKKWRLLFLGHHTLASLLFTTLMCFVLLIPLSWLLGILVKEVQLFVNFSYLYDSLKQ